MATPFAMLVSRLDRRTLLRLGLGGGALVALGVVGGGIALLRPRTPASSFRVLSDDEIAFFDAAAEAFFPPGNVVGVNGREASVAKGLDRLISGLSPRVHRVLHAVVTLIDSYPILALHGMTRFTLLPLEERIAILKGFDASPLEAKRGMANLLRVLVATFVFERADAKAAIGFRGGCEGIPYVDAEATP